MKDKKVHFIAVGGSAMHNLAISLANLGNTVTGSDDHFYNPSKANLAKAGILPEQEGWDPARIHKGLDIVILGMHAKRDNPELQRALDLDLPILSYPELVYKLCQDKQRVVVAGSHGKTTVTSMILHILKAAGKDFDYLVGAAVPGFDISVKLTDEAPVVVIEGDEYLSSALDEKPKFLNYNHHIGVVTGIAWDHINVFPTMHKYVRQFDHFADNSPKGGILIFDEDDDIASVVCKKEREDVTPMPYQTHPHRVENGTTYLIHDGQEYPIRFFGTHNMQNVNAAKTVCTQLGIQDDEFYAAIQTFTGAANRLEKVLDKAGKSVYKDFAHAPSKVKATVEAMKQSFPGKPLTALLELHTFSSLNKNFLGQYKGTLAPADSALVYVNPDVFKQKNLDMFSEKEIQDAFEKEGLKVAFSAEDIQKFLASHAGSAGNVLIMTSGTFGGVEFNNAELY